MYMNGGMGPRGPMNGRGPMHGGSGMGPMHGGMNRGPMPFGPNGIWRRYPMHYGPMWHRRPYHPVMGMWHRPMMGGFGGLFILPILLVILSLFGGVIGMIGEAFSGGGLVFGILIGLAIYYFVKKRNAGESANTNSYVEYEE